MEKAHRVNEILKGDTVSINMGNNKEIPADIDAHYEAVAGQEELYLEETEEEVRAILISQDPSPRNATAECWQRTLEDLEIGWRVEIDERRE